MKNCPFCDRLLAGDICSAHGYVGPKGPPEQVIPKGLICMWGGAATAIPSSWALCDGTNGTPDLREKFILCAGATNAVGVTGGATTHNHSDHAGLAHDSGSLTVSAHSGTDVSSHSGTAVGNHSNHDHGLPFIPGTSSFRFVSGGAGASLTPDYGINVTGATSTAGNRAVSDNATLSAHSVTDPAPHSITQPDDHTVDGSHESQSHSDEDNAPPYYSLAYIQKL